MSKETLILIGAGICLLFFLKLFKIKWKIIISLLINVLIGGIALYFVNYIPGVNLKIDIVSSLVVGLLGLPGVIILLVLYFIN